ncbi:MAG: amino acid adenylation domain-containing protein [Bacteroidales bacterium]|nr:amino acid adenylation domain-containing protein [Bacteroidales bacterium]
MTEDKLCYPLTLPQRSFYYDYLLLKDDCKYNMGGYLLLNSTLNLDLFRQAYKYVINNYDISKLRFVLRNDELMQCFHDDYEADISYFDFRDAENPMEDAISYVLKENSKPLPFIDAPLFYDTIIQTAESQFIWFPRFHHFSNDAYGRSIINNAITDTYNSLLEGSGLPELKSYSYLDFLEDDLKYRESEDFIKSSEYWRQKLTPLPDPLSFTVKKHSVRNISLKTERITLNLHRMCYTSLIRMADLCGATPFQAFLAILNITLFKLYGASDIAVGMPVLNRSNYKFRNTPGLFMNMTILRMHIDPSWTITDMLEVVRSEVKECYRHQRVPLNEILRHFRNVSATIDELFDVTLVYRKMDFTRKLGDEKLGAVTLDTQVRNESLGLEIDEYDDEGNVNIFFNYNPVLISEKEALRLAGCFETILMELIYFPEKSISEIRFLNEYVQDSIIKSHNPDIFKGLKTDQTIVSRFVEIAEKYPDKAAVSSVEGFFTYSQISKKSEGIANALISKFNLKKGDIVSLVVERGAGAIAAMLGIMKAGAVCLPVDINNPRERISTVIKESKSKLTIVDNPLLLSLPGRVVPEEHLDDSPVYNSAVCKVEISQNDPAYIIYTSGSTGVPKGVMIGHGGFMSMFVNMIDVFGVKESDKVLQFASLGFDAAVFEIFQALLTGAELVIAGKEIINDPNLFIRFMDDNRITVATLPPAYLRALEQPLYPHLRTLITAGEKASVKDVNHYSRYKRVINAYGPTEASVCASYYIVPADSEFTGTVPVGRPVAGTSIYIMNNNLELLPPGFEGELCISGPDLALGYHGNQELTDSRFVNDPLFPGRRMYRSGDRAKWLPDGNIEFLGRNDDQLKIKGNRIETGETESHLKNFPEIKDAVVLDVEVKGSRELAAFLVTKEEMNQKEIRLYLSKFLPGYMIPEYYLKVDSYPLNQNGKVDRDSLRQTFYSAYKGNQSDKRSVIDNSAMSDLEIKFISPVSEVLGIENPGPEDNFFESGCDSLKIARLITRIKKELGFEISFKTIFDDPTIRGIASAAKPFEEEFKGEIIPVKKRDYYPLSNAQKRLWILAQDRENAAVYNMPVPLLLEGEIDIKRFIKSVQTVIDRHEILRTIYPVIEGTPYQMILNSQGPCFTEVDLSDYPESDEKARHLVNNEISRPFDISCEVPVRVLLLRTGKMSRVFLLMIHHIAGDGISVSILMDEISLEYNSDLSGKEEPSPGRFRVGYKEFSVYEQELTESVKYQKQKSYWAGKLKKPLSVLNLPCDRPRPAVKTYPGEYKFATLDSSLSRSVVKFSRENHISTFAFLLSAVNVLLRKYTGQEEIVTGMPLSGRNLRETEKMIGLFLNTVVLRNKIDSSSTFRELLESTANMMSEAISNGDYPFDLLVRELDPERDTSRAPLFDVLVQYQNQDLTELKINGARSSLYMASMPFAKFDLTFTFAEKAEVIEFSIGYNTDLFFESRIERMAGHLINIISGVIQNPEIPVSRICIMESSETEAVLSLSTGKEVGTSVRSVVELFEEQVDKNPFHTALVFENKRLTYKQMAEKINHLSSKIRSTVNIGRDDIIAIIAGRSELFVTAIMGVLRSGAAYMPVDPSLPPERIGYMLRESRTKLILTDGTVDFETVLAPVREMQVKVLDISAVSDSIYPDNVTGAFKADPDSLAYLLYTSGSTGTPKGVMIEHRSISNLVSGLAQTVYPGGEPAQNFALLSPFVFDASVKQMFFALSNGHSLDIVPDEVRLNGRKLLDYYREHKIDISDGTPAHLEILLEELAYGGERYLPRKFVIGGQQLRYDTVKKLFEIAGDKQLVINNVYGPTECCDVSSAFEITKEKVDGFAGFAFGPMPVGRPLNNVSIFIADSNLMPVPAGVEGELCIAGEGLARGYIGKEDLTKEKFLLAVFGRNLRVYKTGDIGRFLESGDILLTGRSDDQIKLRGYRIELDEIENCIRSFPDIRSAAVTTVGAEATLEIAAYYTAGKKFGSEELSKYLSSRLPSYMIPSYFTELDTMPLSANGKTDKKALPAPVRTSSETQRDSKPEDLLEEKLCSIWADLLQIKSVGVSDNFFNLGGHSLTAIRLISRIHRDFNVETGIWEIFRVPTVSEQAELIRSKNPSFFNPVPTAEKREYYPLSHSQRRLWVLSKMEGQNSLYNLPAALLLKGKVDTVVFERAFAAIVKRHESFRTSFIEREGEPFQRISEDVEFKIETEVYEDLWNEEIVRSMAEAYFNYEFDLSAAPLLRIKLVKLQGDNWLFLYNMHHIIGDGWSVDVILKEFQLYYDHFLNGTSQLPSPLRIHYKDYAQWQNRILLDDSLNSAREYWHRKLAKPRSETDLPLDFKRGPSFTLDGELLKFSLGDQLAEILKKRGIEYNSSLYMVLLSVVNILLHKYSSQEDIAVGSPVAGRQHYDLDNQVGFYINTLVLRNRVTPQTRFSELLRQVNLTLSEALDNQIYPFDKLVDELDVERIPDRNPLFDVMVAWMVKDGMEMKFSFDSVEAAGLSFPITKSMFDLTFLFEENNGRVGFSIEYNTSLFRRESILRMAGHFEKLLEEIAVNPLEKIGNLSIITEGEQRELLSVCRPEAEAVCPKEADGVMKLFSAQVLQNQNRTAVVSNEERITYGELNRLSDSVALMLKDYVTPGAEDIVTVIVDDPALAVASLLGVLKCGAVYLPVISDTPAERLDYILENSKSKVILSDSGFEKSGRRVINVSSARYKDAPENFKAVENKPGDLAYVIYTSGSTGTPKGVMVEHDALNNLILSLNLNFYSAYKTPLNEFMMSSFAFDVSIKQIFAALCNGNTIHIPDRESRMDPRVISRYIVSNNINIADLTPSVFAVMLEEGFTGAEKPALKEIFLGSEPLSPRLLVDFYSKENNRKIRITNFYGPTECCVESSFYRTDPDDRYHGCDIVPVGKPVLNEQIFILGKNLELCPKGVTGEICIAGKGLARGYLNDPAKTGEKFVPFPLLNGTRIYKTGDLGRIGFNGNVEFEGRIDNQIKIRGFRVELEEIEQSINKFPGIRECVVALYNKKGSEELAAYYTSDNEIERKEIRTCLERYLPKYMIPSYFMRLDSIPLSPNGKRDRKLLPDPVTDSKIMAAGILPVDETEMKILEICRQVLGDSNINIDDNFFEAGGNSLNAVRMISRIESATGIALSLREVFYNPVLQDLARILKAGMERSAGNKNNIEKESPEEANAIIPATEEELKLLSVLQTEDEEESEDQEQSYDKE